MGLNENVQGISTKLTTLNTSLAAGEVGLDTQKFSGVAATARTPFHAINSTDITTTTTVVIKAAVASKKHWITQIFVTNKTPAEVSQVQIEDDTATTPVVIGLFHGSPSTLTTSSGAASHAAGPLYTFDPPIVVAAGARIMGKTIDATTGDYKVHVTGWVED